MDSHSKATKAVVIYHHQLYSIRVISRCRPREELGHIDASCRRRERGDSVWLLSTLGRVQDGAKASGQERNLDRLLSFRTRNQGDVTWKCRLLTFRSPSTWDLSRDSDYADNSQGC